MILRTVTSDKEPSFVFSDEDTGVCLDLVIYCPLGFFPHKCRLEITLVRIGQQPFRPRSGNHRQGSEFRTLIRLKLHLYRDYIDSDRLHDQAILIPSAPRNRLSLPVQIDKQRLIPIRIGFPIRIQRNRKDPIQILRGGILGKIIVYQSRTDFVENSPPSDILL